MYKKKESTPTPQEGNLREETPKSPKGTLRVELRIESSEPEAVRDEVDGIVSNYEKNTPLNPLSRGDLEETPKETTPNPSKGGELEETPKETTPNPSKGGELEETPKSPEGTLREDVFEIDVTSLAAKLGRNIARLIAKGIVQDHYDGDWSKVRFIGLGEEIRDLPRPSEGGELREEHTLRSPKGTLREESSPLIPEGDFKRRILPLNPPPKGDNGGGGMTDKDRILNFVHRECDMLTKMQLPLTEREAEALLEIYSCEDILRQLRKMNNYPKLKRNNRSVYLTCLKWFEMDIAKGYYEKKTRDLPYPSKGGELREEDGSFTSFRMTNKTGMTDKPVTCDEVAAATAEFLERFPPGTAFRTVSCAGWKVINRRVVERVSDSKIMTIAEFVSLGMLEK